MLLIHSVNPTGMFSYGMSENINFINKGLIHLQGINEDKGGDSNGSGKSSLFNSICEMLFRENPTGCKGDDVINAVWDKGMAGRIYFTNFEGRQYRVTYCRKWKDNTLYPIDNDTNTAYLGTSLFLDLYDPGQSQWIDCRGSGMPETNSKVQAAIGMDYKRFLAISYMSPRIGDQFLRGTNKDKMDLLSGITGTNEWDLIMDRSRQKKKALNTQIDQIRGKIQYENGSLQTLKEQYQTVKAFDWVAHIANLNKNLETVRSDWQVQKAKVSSIQVSLDELIANPGYDVEAAANIDQEINKIKVLLSEKERALMTAPSVRDDPSLKHKVTEVSNLKLQVEGSLAAFLGEKGSILEMEVCPTCDNTISTESKKMLSARTDDLKKKIDAFEEQRKAAQDLYEQDKAKRALDLEKRREELHNEVLGLRGKISDLDLLKHEQRKHEAEVSNLRRDLEIAKRALAEKQREGQSISGQVEQAETSIRNVEALDGQIKEKIKGLEFFNKQIDEVSTELSRYLWIIDNIPFIKLHKMSVAMAEISDLCNSYFEEMGDTIRIAISSFGAKVKKANAADVKDLMKSEIKIEIVDGSKKISPKLYSDGESSKVSISLIRAFNEMARKSGQGCNLMVMDEVFSFVDAENSQKIAGSMSKLLKRGTVFLTDNSGKVEDLINFDSVWVARKFEGKTIIEQGV